MTWTEYFAGANRTIIETAELRAAGATCRLLRTAVTEGSLIRVRRGYYALPATSPRVIEAVRVGGRLGCISAIADAGGFAFEGQYTHIHVGPGASRLRAPQNRLQRLTEETRNGVELHWDELRHPSDGNEFSIGLPDALIQIFRCQQPRLALATVDNVLHLRLLPWDAVAGIFAALPADLQYLQSRIDARTESGQETVLRWIVLEAGIECEIQVTIEPVGRVDLLIAGFLVVEADSRSFHDGWDRHSADRTRDCDLAALGYVTYRALYKDIMYHPERVIAAIMGLLATHEHFRTVIV
ncbi:type IV toxin-antitoxin system AbiEi family antitoxin domain-containing protein [Cryobacterium sp. CG_9.6]|uniref:type IV toxin-antitoxin system AbiEi family antitoxin domain-containing protein n=1 Tax=Cryobacterium sp. CG_9.6 TaxID=2760710 RepID=UPI002475FECF|nr:type IV toxin-antitoxin system AbiEi family antitoxin domain-containing protein [Cryobacterium sp. CG_9.6]MDH6235892.1 very-short-patch-repair endonuclease [Cryobacterium sp. CG_9.6]